MEEKSKKMQRLEENIMGINGFLQLSVQRRYQIYPHVFSVGMGVFSQGTLGMTEPVIPIVQLIYTV